MCSTGSVGEVGDFELGAGAGVESIAPGIAQEIEGQHGDHDGERREDEHVRGVEEVAAGIVEHGAPPGDGREDAEAEEAQRASRVDRAVALRYE
jgi:hypothetical protein